MSAIGFSVTSGAALRPQPSLDLYEGVDFVDIWHSPPAAQASGYGAVVITWT
jgi:hypothetical protein